MSFWKQLFGGSSKQTPSPAPESSQSQRTLAAQVAPQQSGPSLSKKSVTQPGNEAIEPKPSCIYIFSSAILKSDERQEALWGGFFAKHTTLDRRIAEHVEMRGAIIGISPAWQRGELNNQHALELCDAALNGLFDDEHKGACYLDAILLYPEKPPVFVVMVWNVPAARRAQQRIPGVQLGLTPASDAKPPVTVPNVASGRATGSGKCDVCGVATKWADGHALTTRQVMLESSYWNFLFKNQGQFNIGDLETQSQILGHFIRQHASSGTGWLICESCSQMFKFDKAVAKEYAVKEQSPPGSGPVDFNEILPVAMAAKVLGMGFFQGETEARRETVAAAPPLPPKAPPLERTDMPDAPGSSSGNEDLNLRDNNGTTALMRAAGGGALGILTPLIRLGADVNAKNDDGLTALMSAAAKGSADCVRALIAAGADVNAKYNDGMTVLMWAAFTGDADCVKALIAAGADVNAKISYVWGGNNNRGGWTAPDFADLAGNAEVAAILRSERART